MTSGYGSTYDAKQDRIAERDAAFNHMLFERVRRLRALFVVHGWSDGRVMRDGKTRFGFIVNGTMLEAVLCPDEKTVTFIPIHRGVVEYHYSIEKQMLTIESFIEHKVRPTEEPTKLTLINVDDHEAYIMLLPNATVELGVDYCNSFQAVRLTLDQLVGVRNELTGIINVIREKHGL